jgi:hypothetical protein
MTINIPVPSLTSWKTTLIGTVSILLAAMQTYHDASFMVALQDPRVQMAVVVGILGLFSKDSNVTGGSVPATPEAENRVVQKPKV